MPENNPYMYFLVEWIACTLVGEFYCVQLSPLTTSATAGAALRLCDL